MVSPRKPVAKRNTIRFYFDENDRLNGKSKATGKPYPTHTRCCLHCGHEFKVVHYPGMRWVHIKWCCRDCCWLYRYGRKYELSPEEKEAHRIKKRATQRTARFIQSWTPDERAHVDHLTAQFL